MRGAPWGQVSTDITGWIYFAGAYEGGELRFVKIGYTGARNPRSRIKSLQQGMPLEVRILTAIGGCIALEKRYHKEFNASQVRGEWFRPTQEILCRIETCLAMRGSWKPWYAAEKRKRRGETRTFAKAEGLIL